MAFALLLWDAEDGDDPAWAGDLDLSSQRFDERFPLAVRAGADDLVDVLGDLTKRRGRRHRGRGGELGRQLIASGRQLPGPGLELGEPSGEVFGFKGAVLERGQVPVDRGVGLSQLVLGGVKLGSPGGPLRNVLQFAMLTASAIRSYLSR